MKGIISHITVLLILLTFSACKSPDNITYFQDFKSFDARALGEKYQLTFRTDDMLNISVSSKNPELAAPFNSGNLQQGEQAGYLIDAEGCINFPILGRIKVLDMNRKTLEEYIQNRLIQEDLLKDPIVTVRLLNFKVLVLGEVGSPQLLSVNSDRLTLLSALTMAGDLTPNARRDRIAVIREIDNERTVLYHDIRNSKIFDSPYYYLKQNDIIYVEPNQQKISEMKFRRVSVFRDWFFTSFSLITTLVTLIVVL